MPLKVQPIDTSKPPEKMAHAEYARRRTIAYHSGLLNQMYSPKFTFESDEYERGRADDIRTRQEIQLGQR